MPINNASRRTKLFIFDGFTAVPLLLAMVYPRYSTICILLIVSFIIFIYEKKGVSLPMLIRRVKTSITGNSRYIRSSWRRP